MKCAPRGHPAARNASRSRHIPPEALEVIADVFLACSQKEDDCPAYSEDQLDRKRRHALRAELCFGISIASRYAALRPSANDILAEAGLTPSERTAWQMFSEGYNASEIARSLRIGRPTAVRLLRSAAGRISTCETALRGLGEVYHSEVHRYVYRKPTHCGEQPCRHLGYCKYALHAETCD